MSTETPILPTMGIVLLAVALTGCSDSKGSRCNGDGDCAGGICKQAAFAVDDLDGLPLVCGSASEGAEPFAVCTDASDCARGICLLSGTCGLPCVEDEDCANDARCGRAYAVGKPAAPTAHPVNVCLERVVATVPVSHETSQHELEAPAVGETLSLAGPVETTTLFVLDHHDALDLLVTRLTALPAGTELFDLADITPGDAEAPLNPVDDAGQPVIVQLPNGPRAEGHLDASTYEARVRSQQPGTVDVARFSGDRRGPGRLDLNIFYVAGEGWAPQQPRGPPMLREALERVGAFLRPAGIRLGSLRQRVVPGMLHDNLSVITGGPTRRRPRFREMLELFELSAGAGNAALNVFLVKSIEGPDGARLGMAGGVPVPWGMHGTGASGIVLAVGSMPDAATLARWMAHEIGHALGLFHTTERDGTVLDPLSDTSRCPLANDADGDGRLSAEECEGRGAGNLMFWDAGGDTLTAQQAEVMQRAWILR